MSTHIACGPGGAAVQVKSPPLSSKSSPPLICPQGDLETTPEPLSSSRAPTSPSREASKLQSEPESNAEVCHSLSKARFPFSSSSFPFELPSEACLGLRPASSSMPLPRTPSMPLDATLAPSPEGVDAYSHWKIPPSRYMIQLSM
ncbi:hypothetical protein PISMIDRAFT_16571 [Pisolithus microcarpus 441]|uniref:Uncharacterized protein n=1 Tax=Pisolithus microcarpus 441 TaxID=765257 RepID=A0A0C9Z5U8_9AGAM|nr:hypothetical protein PISMIDRAFT_16571 [Pisolithus microcarpus 441]